MDTDGTDLDVLLQPYIYIEDEIIIFDSDIDFEAIGEEFESPMVYPIYIEATTTG